MSIDLSSKNINSMCVGCLSIDRKLQPLNEESTQMYYRFLDLSDRSEPMPLCYECCATLRRMVRFKKQVKHAHTYLNTMIHKKNPASLSNLNVRKIVHINSSRATFTGEDAQNIVLFLKYNPNVELLRNCCMNDGEIKNENDIDEKSSVNPFKMDEKSRVIDEKSSISDEISRLDEKSSKIDECDTEPMAFIKMEDPECDGIDADDNHDGIEENDGKVSVNPKESGFEDSDDEPLKLKSQKYKERRKRCRKKKKNDSPNILKPKKGQVKEQWGVVSDPRVARKLRDLNIDSGHMALVLLTWEEVEEERRLTLASASFARHAHRCDACAVGFNHKHKLHAHMMKHSEAAGAEVCEFCAVRCKTPAALCAHRRRHRARWVCQWCGARYSAACVCADHCARAHGVTPPTHRCARCDVTATSLGKLRMHMKSHSSRPECALCGKSFRDKSSLRTHAFVHRGEKEHACSVCGKTFMFKKQKEIHEITHMDHQNLYCLKCDVTFKNQTSYYQHMKYNLKHIDPADIKYQCKLCDKKFVKAKRLEEHNLAVHLKLAPVHCKAVGCTFACASRAALRSHARSVHRAQPLRVRVCHLCGHTYKSKKSLESHLRSHSSARRGQMNEAVVPT